MTKLFAAALLAGCLLSGASGLTLAKKEQQGAELEETDPAAWMAGAFKNLVSAQWALYNSGLGDQQKATQQMMQTAMQTAAAAANAKLFQAQAAAAMQAAAAAVTEKLFQAQAAAAMQAAAAAVKEKTEVPAVKEVTEVPAVTPVQTDTTAFIIPKGGILCMQGSQDYMKDVLGSLTMSNMAEGWKESKVVLGKCSDLGYGLEFPEACFPKSSLWYDSNKEHTDHASTMDAEYVSMTKAAHPDLPASLFITPYVKCF